MVSNDVWSRNLVFIAVECDKRRGPEMGCRFCSRSLAFCSGRTSLWCHFGPQVGLELLALYHALNWTRANFVCCVVFSGARKLPTSFLVKDLWKARVSYCISSFRVWCSIWHHNLISVRAMTSICYESCVSTVIMLPFQVRYCVVSLLYTPSKRLSYHLSQSQMLS